MNKQSASIRALIFLQDKLDKGVWQKGSKLPPVIRLAKNARIGISSMYQAIAVLKRKKVLSVRQKSGIYVGIPLDKSSKGKQYRPLKGETLVRKMKIDILEGIFHEVETLPSQKELAVFYKTGFATLRKALDYLASENFIEHDKRKYRILKTKSPAPSGTVYLLVSEQIAHMDLLWNYLRTFVEEFIRTLEKECKAKNMRLVQCVVSYPSLYNISFDDAHGIVVWNCQYVNEQLFTLIDYLSRFKKPVCIMTIPNTWFAPKLDQKAIRILQKKRTIYLSDYSADRNAGYQMGRFLFDKGHHRVCYIGAFRNGNPWSAERLKGLTEAFASVNIPGAVTELSPVNPADNMPPDPQSDISPDPDLVQSIEKEFKFLEEIEGRLKTHFVSYINQHKTQQTLEQLYEKRYGYELLRTYLPIFEKALSITGCNVWVCADDSIANYAAYPFLTLRGIAVPGRVALTGFNDQIESMFHQLTSYHFNYALAARKILNLIFFPNSAWRYTNPKGPILFSFDGMIIDRGSV